MIGLLGNNAFLLSKHKLLESFFDINIILQLLMYFSNRIMYCIRVFYKRYCVFYYQTLVRILQSNNIEHFTIIGLYVIHGIGHSRKNCK